MHRQCAKEGYHYEAILLNGKLAGYIGWALHEDELFLSKLYLAKPFRKHGLAAAALSHLKKEAAKAKKESILLTVNRYNQDSVEVYRHWGFATIREEKTPIGEGYVMDDYIMRLMLSPKESASC